MRKVFIAALMGAAALAACNKESEAVIVQEAPADSGGADYAASTPPAAAPAPGEAAPVAGETPAAPAPGNVPVRKPGLWQITTSGERTTTSTLCVSAATETGRRSGVFATLGGGRGMGGPGAGGGQRPGGDGDRGDRQGGERPSGDRPGGGDGERRAGGQGGGGFGGGAACLPKVSATADGWQSISSCSIPRGDTTMKTSSKLTLTGDLETKYSIKGSTTTSGSQNAERNGTRPVSITGVYKGACPAGMKAGDLKGADGEVRNLLLGRQGGGGGGQR